MQDIARIRMDAELALKLYENSPEHVQRRTQTKLLGSLAAFVCSIADTTTATSSWVAQVTPTIENAHDGVGYNVLAMADDGGLWLSESITGEQSYMDGPWTRGRVRLLALTLGLELREGG